MAYCKTKKTFFLVLPNHKYRIPILLTFHCQGPLLLLQWAKPPESLHQRMNRLKSHLRREEGGQGGREEREGGGRRRKIGRIEPLQRPDGMEVSNKKRRREETRGEETRSEETRGEETRRVETRGEDTTT